MKFNVVSGSQATEDNTSAEPNERIQKMVENNPVFLFMKGNAEMPQCGFSAQVIGILKSYDVDFSTKNVLEDEETRQGIKEFSDWPTIPQLYIKGEFVGGCDIVMEMHEKGELKKLLAT